MSDQPNEGEGPNPSGLCMCGCGRRTKPAARSGKGLVEGQPTRFLHGHGKLAAPLADAPSTKQCTVCGEEKSLEAFRKQKRSRFGRCSYCKACNAEAVRRYYRENPRKKLEVDLKKQYGLSLAQYERMMDEQGNRCAICGQPERRQWKNGTRPSRLAVDHDHETGRVRALLCFGCNAALGGFGHDPGRLRKAAAYLERHVQP